MTDCSLLPAELTQAQQELAAMPSPIPYCNANWEEDGYPNFKACVTDIRRQIFALDVLINDLSNKIKICKALIGTWTIHSTNPIVNNSQFTITAWDTDGPLQVTFTFYDGVPGEVIAADYGVLVLISSIPELYLTIAARPDIGAPLDMGYGATLDSNTPQFINGNVGGLANSAWTATKS